jgi:hypothetical protein
MHGCRQGPARRNGSGERRAGARADLVGVRDSNGRRTREGRCPAQARTREQGREPTPAGSRPPARRDGDHPADPTRVTRGEAAFPATLRARRDARQRHGREAAARLAFGPSRCAGARRRSALARAGRSRPAGLGGGRLPRCRAHLDRQLRAGEARDQGTQPLRLTSARPTTRHDSDRQHARVALPCEKRLARALAKPGHELQHRFATAEPSPEQIEVAEAALAACLELERE